MKKGCYLMIFSFFRFCYRPPFVQTSLKNTTMFVWVTLVITLIAYGRFASLVIWGITNYLGVACFTVKKKEGEGDEQPNANKRL